MKYGSGYGLLAVLVTGIHGCEDGASSLVFENAPAETNSAPRTCGNKLPDSSAEASSPGDASPMLAVSNEPGASGPSPSGTAAPETDAALSSTPVVPANDAGGAASGKGSVDPNMDSGAGSSADAARVAAQCGNSQLDGEEECDDGNSVTTDGCAACLVTPGFQCDGGSGASACIEAVVPSCEDLTATCGDSSETCCRSARVPGGEFGPGEPAQGSATVATFALDKYEVTVGRFRQFVAAYAGPPAAGEGAHPLIAESGWREDWNTEIAASAAVLAAGVACDASYQTWDDSGEHDALPMNCVNWYEGFAFCAWDGGRLPTEAEWEYTAAGGADERMFPWGDAAATRELAAYACLGDGSALNVCAFADLQAVGSHPEGAGKYGQLDLAGSVAEWTLDWQGPYQTKCENCANLSPAAERVTRGGDWLRDASLLVAASAKVGAEPVNRSPTRGFRCARPL